MTFKQPKLEQFFRLKVDTNLNGNNNTCKNHKKCFIYDPDNNKAFFENSNAIGINDVFLTTKCNVKLYYRKPLNTYINKELIIIYNPNNYRNIKINKDIKISIPLIKSNLQKAIRRRNLNEALGSALLLINLNSIEFLRRLPIIYVEDVCLIDSYPMVMWLLMADKEHQLTIYDVNMLLNVIFNLHTCVDFYDDPNSHYIDKCKMELTHENLLEFSNYDCLLALYYRSQYGGLKGDMLMIKNAIWYYATNPDKIIKTNYNYTNITIESVLDYEVKIIPGAIDFHPFPQMITILAKQTGEDKEEIRKTIWHAESAINFRKPDIIKNSCEYKQTECWNLISKKIKNVREYLTRIE